MGQVTDKKENICSKTKRIAKFVWRHILTLYILSIILRAIFSGHIEGGNALGVLGIAIFLDWGKQFIKFRSSSVHYIPHPKTDPYNDVTVALHIRQWWNPGLIGTGAYESDNYKSSIKYD